MPLQNSDKTGNWSCLFKAGCYHIDLILTFHPLFPMSSLPQLHVPSKIADEIAITWKILLGALKQKRQRKIPAVYFMRLTPVLNNKPELPFLSLFRQDIT